MSRIVKKLSEGSEYLIVAANAAPTTFTVGEWSTLNASVTINGNLNVMGTQTTISSTDMAIADHIITLNAGTTGAPTENAGLEVDRGDENNATLIWNETVDRWQITNDGGATWGNIATISGSSYLTRVVEDLTPQLGGNLDVNGHTITSASGSNVVISPDLNTQFETPLQLKEILIVPPTSITGYGLLFAGPVSNGDTGVYVTHSAVQTQELITKRRALFNSIIF
jgi:hypothetical protein